MQNGKIVFVLGADLRHQAGGGAAPGPETTFALQAGVVTARENHCAITATAGFSNLYGVDMAPVMLDWVAEQRAGVPVFRPPSLATVFNTQGEVEALWRSLAGHQILIVHVVARGLHAYRATFLVWHQKPPEYRHVQVVRVKAASEDRRLLGHEIKSWLKIGWRLLTGQLRRPR